MKKVIRMVEDAISADLSRRIVEDEVGMEAGAESDAQPKISERDNGDGTVTLSMVFSYNPARYESSVAPKSEVQRKNDAIENEDIVDAADEQDEQDEDGASHAEDAAPLPGVSGAAQQCAATFQQCQAKNPYACRFHGAKLMEGDLNSDLANAGVQNASVTISAMPHQGTFKAEVKCRQGQQKAVQRALANFSKRPGIDAGSVMYAGYNKTTGVHTSLYDVDTKYAAQTAGAPAQANTAAAAQTAPAQPQAASAGVGQAAPSKAKTVRRPRARKAAKTQQQTQPQAQAPSAAQAQQTQQQASAPLQAQTTSAVPTPKPGAMLHPPTRPPEPPKWTGLVDDDFDFLDKTSVDLAFLAQRVNHNLSKSSPTPGAGSVAAQNFAAIDRNRLVQLAKKDTTGQVQRVLDVYDEAKKSEANGWNDKILAAKYDESKYDSGDPKASTDFSSWGFDRRKCPSDPHAAARKAYAEWVPPVQKRDEELSLLKANVSSAQASERPGLDALMDDASAASEDMKSFEDDIGLLEDAVAAEKDPSVKADLQKLMDSVDAAYFAAKRRYDDAVGQVRKWASSQTTMSESFGYDEIENFYKSRGLPIPLGVKNWKAFITDQKLQDESEQIIMRNSKFSSRPLWQTHQQRLDRIKQLRKNLCLLMPHLHIYHKANDFILTSIPRDAAVRADASNSNYQNGLKNAFGVKTRGSAKDMQLYCAISLADSPKNSTWCQSSSYGKDFVVELDPNKVIGGICWDNGCGYWTGSDPKGMSHVSQMNFSDIAYGSGDNHFNPKAAEVDFTGMTPSQMFSIMFPEGEGGYEFHVVNGADFKTGNTKAIYEKQGTFTASASAVMKKYGVAAYDKNFRKL